MKPLTLLVFLILGGCQTEPWPAIYEPNQEPRITVTLVDPKQIEHRFELPLYSTVDPLLAMLDCPECDTSRLNPTTVLKDGDRIVLREPVEACISLNQGTEEELTSLPGIGPSLAQRIIAEREANGFFQTLEDIQRVKGIKQALYAKIEARICL